MLSSPLFAMPETAGVVVLPAATMAEMAKEPVPFVSAHLARDHERHERESETQTSYLFSYRPTATPMATVSISSPYIDTAFRDAYDPPRAYPADASGAVGPHHLVAMTNDYITVHDRTGKSLSSLYVEQFWGETVGFLFDPRVAYDETRDRWVAAMLVDTNMLDAYLLLAVSTSGDPLGTWRRYKIPAVTTNNKVADLDFTRLTVTADNILIAAELYESDHLTGTVVFVINAADAYGAILAPVVNRIATLDMVRPVSTTQSSNFFVSSSAGGIALWRLIGSTSLSYVGRWPQLSSFPDYLAARQLGTVVGFNLFTDFIQGAVMNDGLHIWTVRDFGGAVLVTKGDINGGASTMTFADPTGSSAYAFPSMAVTSDGSALVTWAVFNSGAYISSQGVFIDKNGNASAPLTIKKGEGPYQQNRWGDYTTTVVDPVAPTSFWTLQIYPMLLDPPGRTVWATWWAHVMVAGKRVHAVRH